MQFYWVANFFADFFKAQLKVLVIIIIMYANPPTCPRGVF